MHPLLKMLFKPRLVLLEGRLALLELFSDFPLASLELRELRLHALQVLRSRLPARAAALELNPDLLHGVAIFASLGAHAL
ncbi:MAG: hypothetical protein P8Z31_12370, partial [Gammaproteobacteria bacterium]